MTVNASGWSSPHALAQSTVSAFAWRTFGQAVSGRRVKYSPKASATARFIWWSTSHSAVRAIWAGNSSTSIPKHWSTSTRMRSATSSTR